MRFADFCADIDKIVCKIVKYLYKAMSNLKVLNDNGGYCRRGMGALNSFRCCWYYYDTESDSIFSDTMNGIIGPLEPYSVLK